MKQLAHIIARSAVCTSLLLGISTSLAHAEEVNADTTSSGESTDELGDDSSNTDSTPQGSSQGETLPQDPAGSSKADPVSPGTSSSGENDGLFGPYRFGLMAAGAFPGLTHFSLESRFFGNFGASIGFGGLESKSKDVEFETKHWDIRGRWFPFAENFFLGAALGSTNYNGKIAKSIDLSAGGVTKAVPTSFEAEISRTELTPMLGWQWITSIGLTFGLDLGWQMALSSSSEVTIDPQGLSDAEKAQIKDQAEYKDAEKQLKDNFLDVFKDQGLPNITLGIGWML